MRTRDSNERRKPWTKRIPPAFGLGVRKENSLLENSLHVFYVRPIAALATSLTICFIVLFSLQQSAAESAFNVRRSASGILGPTSAGSLDPTFGNGGKVTDWSGGTWEVAIQPDGKIVAAGLNLPFSWSGPPPNHNFLIARYNADGSPDFTFGGGTGRVTIDSGLRDYVTGIAIQGDGKIVLSGRFEGPGGSGVLVRLNADGSRDTAFGSNGIATTNCTPSSIAVQPNGRIVVSHRYVGACRHNANGSPDMSFGVGGFANTDISEAFEYQYSFSLVTQPDGKVIVAGGIDQENSNPPRFSVLIRYNPDGTLDTSFGGTGIVTTRPNDDFGLTRKLLLQANGKIVALSEWTIARYNADGSLDSGFGSGGIVSVAPWPYDFRDVALQTDGNIVVSGADNYPSATRDFAIARYTTTGSLDLTFGGGDGITTVDFDNADDEASAVALDSQGRAVVAGMSNERFAFARILLRSNPCFDYDGDGKTDFSVFRPSNGTWYVARSQTSDMYVRTVWSAGGLMPADYDGDGKTDIATTDLDTLDNNSILVILNSSTNTVSVRPFFFGDRVVSSDFDGDGKADPAVWTDGLWQIAMSQNGSVYTQQWGVSGDKPVPADFDGDGKAELAIWRPSDGRWYVANITTGSISVIGWGVNGDIPVVGDYSGDGRADYAVYRPSNNSWYRLHSSDFSMYIQSWGMPNDIVTPGDYDGDGRTDLSIFRPSEGKWYVMTAAHVIITSSFGQNGDVPTPGAFVY